MQKYIIGIDTGGTFTDAVLLDRQTGNVIAATKKPTTHYRLAKGTGEALTALLATGRITTRLGVSFTLALVPLIMLGGWVVVAMSPVLASVVATQIIRRAGLWPAMDRER